MTKTPRAQPITAAAVARIRSARQARGISAQRLADAITARGYPVSRSDIAEAEIGLRRTIPVDLVVHAAAVLRVPVARLMSAPEECRTCRGKPPPGFTCDTCGASITPKETA